jgi:hypothetical protein
MPDWTKLVRANLEARDLAAEEREEVVHEIAAHLEDASDAALASGLNEATAEALALQAVENWAALARRITRAKSTEGLMNYRTRSLWIPTLITLAAASTSLLLIQFMGMEPRFIWVDVRRIAPLHSPFVKVAMEFYWPWLTSLPFCGALGAYLSRRSRGNTSARLLAGVSPALIMLTVMCGFLPFGLVFDGLSFFRLVAFALGVVNWVAIPAAALLLGALPCLQGARPAKA